MAIKIAVLCVAACVICVAIRVSRPEIAMAVGLFAGLTACIMALDEMKAIAQVLKSAAVGNDDMALIMKACGLALIGEYAASLCRDAGENALSQRIDFSVRISLLAMASPMAIELMKTILEFSV